jgi:hypothetical protein
VRTHFYLLFRDTYILTACHLQKIRNIGLNCFQLFTQLIHDDHRLKSLHHHSLPQPSYSYSTLQTEKVHVFKVVVIIEDETLHQICDSISVKNSRSFLS